jgi:glycosyltransferase involved in cell wall biosynthesis
MRNELGPHPNAHVLYPIGADTDLAARPDPTANDHFTFCFAGNLDRWYGTMVHDLMQASELEPTVRLRVFGANHRWPVEFVKGQIIKGVFHGFRPFEQLIPELQKADAFLLPMGFGADAALIERTSFKTKLLDYILFEKPILVWGPEYSTAIAIARKYECAHCVTNPSPKAALAGMKELAQDRSLREILVQNARKMRAAEFTQGKTYSILKTELEKLLIRK